ncbi:MAG: N-acetylglucosamine kinase [Planctomycetaceae bacterium]
MSSPEHPSHTLIIAIDGGGTKTDCRLALADGDLQILGQGLAGPSNLRALGAERALANLDAAVTAAFAAAGLERCTTSAACLALAGADRTSEQMQILEWAGSVRLADQLRIVNDAVPLLFTGSGHGIGVALIAGTGSLAWGCNAEGRTARAGGWGYLLGDEGSAYAIGNAALRAVLMQADGRGPQTLLTEILSSQLEIARPSAIVERVYGAVVPRQVIAELAPLVFHAAHHQDMTATEIIRLAAGQLAHMATSVARSLELPTPLPLACTGAVLIHQQTYLAAVADSIRASTGISPAITCVPEPVLGALKLARNLRAPDLPTK